MCKINGQWFVRLQTNSSMTRNYVFFNPHKVYFFKFKKRLMWMKIRYKFLKTKRKLNNVHACQNKPKLYQIETTINVTEIYSDTYEFHQK